MTVKKLIEHLIRFPQDAEVYLPLQQRCSGTIKEIRMGRNKKTEDKVVFYVHYSHVKPTIEYPESRD